MKRFFFLAAGCAALTACAAGVAPQASLRSDQAVASTATSCGASSYAYLIGRPATDAREIAGDYRMTTQPDAQQNGTRVTVVYSPNAQQITDVRCG